MLKGFVKVLVKELAEEPVKELAEEPVKELVKEIFKESGKPDDSILLAKSPLELEYAMLLYDSSSSEVDQVIVDDGPLILSKLVDVVKAPDPFEDSVENSSEDCAVEDGSATVDDDPLKSENWVELEKACVLLKDCLLLDDSTVLDDSIVLDDDSLVLDASKMLEENALTLENVVEVTDSSLDSDCI